MKRTQHNTPHNQKIRGLTRKLDAIEMKGGKCEVCGYDKNLAALEFHHLDPSLKNFQIDLRSFANKCINSLKLELSKTILLCSNCHREMHNPELSIENAKNILTEYKSVKSSFNTQYGQECPVCGKIFHKATGKIFCSGECYWKNKNYPSYKEIQESYNRVGSWEKVAKEFGLTRKIIRGIRKRNEIQTK